MMNNQTKRPQPSDQECRAYREAGRVAIAFDLKHPVSEVSIHPPTQPPVPDILGDNTPEPLPFKDQTITLQQVENEVQSLFAGDLAEATHRAKPNPKVSIALRRHAANLLRPFIEDPQGREQHVNGLEAKARDALRDPWAWAGVRELAAALVQKERVPVHEARNVYFAARTPRTGT